MELLSKSHVNEIIAFFGEFFGDDYILGLSSDTLKLSL